MPLLGRRCRFRQAVSVGVGCHAPDQLPVIDADRAPQATSRQRSPSAMEHLTMLKHLTMLIQKSRACAGMSRAPLGRLARYAMLACVTAGLAVASGGSETTPPAL